MLGIDTVALRVTVSIPPPSPNSVMQHGCKPNSVKFTGAQDTEFSDLIMNHDCI